MVEFISVCFDILHNAGTFPLHEGVLPVLRVALLLGASAVGIGLWIASRLARPWRASPADHPQTACLLHDWLRLDDGGFVCLRCSYRAGSSLASVPRRPR